MNGVHPGFSSVVLGSVPKIGFHSSLIKISPADYQKTRTFLSLYSSVNEAQLFENSPRSQEEQNLRMDLIDAALLSTTHPCATNIQARSIAYSTLKTFMLLVEQKNRMKASTKNLFEPDEKKYRWKAIISYNTGPVTHYFDEIRDLHNIVERGPDFRFILDITITYAWG